MVDEDRLSLWQVVVMVCLVLGVSGFVGYVIWQESTRADNGIARYDRAMRYAMLPSFYPVGELWGVNENMTIREAREMYLVYETRAMPFAVDILSDICDGKSYYFSDRIG